MTLAKRKPVLCLNQQQAQLYSPISTIVLSLDSIILLVSLLNISGLCPTSVTAQAGLCLTCSHDQAHDTVEFLNFRMQETLL